MHALEERLIELRERLRSHDWRIWHATAREILLVAEGGQSMILRGDEVLALMRGYSPELAWEEEEAARG